MRFKLFRVACITLLLFGTVMATAVQATGGEEGGNRQSPVQVIVQIVAAGVALKFLQYFDLP